jgi:hypothetical protein
MDTENDRIYDRMRLHRLMRDIQLGLRHDWRKRWGVGRGGGGNG